MTRQSINYKYNIRGWLTDINNVNLGMLGEYQFPMSAYHDLFSFKIMYNEIYEDTGNGAEKLYNGNIAQTFWKTGSNNKLRGYDYSYDSLNRLLRAEFYNSEVQPYTGAYNEIINYDLNGNITSLNRTTGDNSGAAVAMDELTYTYKDGNGNSNVLLNVSDAVSPQSTDGFIDGNTDPMLNDYEYDQNGNMILDRNKGITEIKYNHLNLPTRITWANNKYISYQYNAAGQKVRKTVDNNDGLKIVDYLDGFQYAGSVLQFFPTAEGYVKATPIDRINSDYHFNYIYNYTDHLGNVRLSYTLDPQTGKLRIVDEHHYYPFGLRHEVHYPSGNRLDFHPLQTSDIGEIENIQLINVTKTEYLYRYNAKEWQDELGLDWYDYGWRNYDPALGRWMNIDPLSEEFASWSTYSFVYNNPIKFFDPTGLAAQHDYKLLKNGEVRLIRETNDNSDTLYSTDDLGQVTSESNSITISKDSPSDTTIIGELSQGASSGGWFGMDFASPYSYFSEGFTDNLETGFSLFNFLRENTTSGIEFSLSKFSVDGTDSYQIATMHKIDGSKLASNRYSLIDMVWTVHNHDGEVGLMYQEIGNQWSKDKSTLRGLIRDAKKNKLGFPRMFTVNDANQMIEVKWGGAENNKTMIFNTGVLSTLNRVYKSK